MIVSQPLIEEVERNLACLHFNGRVAADDGDDFVLLPHQFATPTPLTVDVRGVASHPEDDLILATAVSASADSLVTGDKRLLQVKSHLGVAIIVPGVFMDALA